MKWRSYFLLILLPTLFSCAKKENNNKSVPTSIIKNEGLVIKVFDYKGLEPLLNRQNDTTYVVNFWATWCKPCVKELPYFEMLGKHYSAYKVKVLLVSLDMESQIQSKLIPFMKKQHLESEVVVLDDVDANSWISKISSKWTGAIPATIIYNTKKRLFFERSFNYKELETQVKRML